MTTVTRIKTDRSNYSRYDDRCNVITATLYLDDPATPGDVLSVTLVREDGYGVVLTVPATVGVTPYVRVKLPLESCLDPQYTHIYRARGGSYTVRVGAVASPAFSVSLVSIRRLREEVCKGLTLLTGDTVGPVEQPKLVTGVTITQVKPDVPGDVYTLHYTAMAQTLSFDNGAAVDISAGGTAYLVSQLNRFWIQIDVDEILLPTSDQTESIIIDEQQFTDNALLAEIRHAEAEVADELQAFLEPTQVCTEHLLDWIKAPSHAISPPTNAFADVITAPVNYNRPTDWNNWYEVDIPAKRLIQVEALHGFLNQTDVVTLDQSWWVWTEMTGQVQLVPNQGAAVSWQFYTGFFYNFLMGSYDYVPQFWHYKATVGFRDLREKRANILQAVEYRCGVNVLRQAALHAKPGYTSESIARDGIQSNIQYQKAIYGDTIELYERWLAENMPKLKTRHTGIKMLLF